MPRPGDAIPKRADLLVNLLELGVANVPTLAGALNAWNRHAEVADMLGDLAASGLIEPGPSGAWRLTDTGDRAARRPRT